MKISSNLVGLFMVLLGFILCTLFYVSSPGTFDDNYSYVSREPDLLIEKTIYDMQINARQSNESYHFDNDDFMQIQTNVQKRRKQILERGCYLSSNRLTHLNMAIDPPRNLIVDDKNQLIYCFVPKVACTSWKMVFLQLNGFLHPGKTLPQYFVNRPGLKKLSVLEEYTLPQRRYILGHYKKFMFTRNPYSRVLSVYRNKLDPGSTFDRAKKWQNTLGKVIASKFKDKKSITNSSLTFPKFISFLLQANSPDNRHWKSVYDSCFPCDVKYDVIGRFETLETDAKYILKLIGKGQTIHFPQAEQSSPTNSSKPEVLKEYYSKVSRRDMKKLYAKYKLDFELFGYSEMKFDKS
ncbi:carbohydrate sulfotransferase 11-like [Amphiura filiformis]|uniref:carbohydrate sulfotransferase 11-like n=1 Tax=Amphiura filiformis TaxID=82378 RepID=UPI003B21FA36